MRETVVVDVPAFGEHGVIVIRIDGGRLKVLERLSTESALAGARALKRRMVR